jgi:hypothetical protein
VLRAGPGGIHNGTNRVSLFEVEFQLGTYGRPASARIWLLELENLERRPTLILAFSRKEKESYSRALCVRKQTGAQQPVACEQRDGRRVLLPLLGGEGWGEGEPLTDRAVPLLMVRLEQKLSDSLATVPGCPPPNDLAIVRLEMLRSRRYAAVNPGEFPPGPNRRGEHETQGISHLARRFEGR